MSALHCPQSAELAEPVMQRIVVEESGEEFKRSLVEHVERVRTGVPEPTDRDNESHDKIKGQPPVLEKLLRTFGINGSIRIDEASGKGSVIDVIKLVCPGATGDYANKALRRVIAKDRDEQERVGHNNEPVSIADHVDYIRINGKGHTTPVSDANTIIEIIWLLPGKAAREFRRRSAEIECRVLGGDTSICAEIESRCADVQSSEQGRGFQNSMSGDAVGSPAKRARVGPETRELVTAELNQELMKIEVQHQLEMVTKFNKAFEQIRGK